MTGWSGERARQLASFYRECVTQEVAGATVKALAKYDVTALLPGLNVPTLVICQADSAWPPVSDSRYLAAHIPGARMVVTENEGGDFTAATVAIVQFIAEGAEDASEGHQPALPEDAAQTRTSSPPETKTFASGRYVVQRLLGEGAQKTVYLVHDTALERDCALSLLKTELLEADDLARLRREGQTMAQLGTQPNIVTVFDYGEEDGAPFIVCEYVPGSELREELAAAAGPLPLERALAVAMDICRALSFAHGRDIVHRDIKPANIWLTEDGSAKLGDFGIARGADRSGFTMTEAMMRTAAYLAPEQAQGQEVTVRSDLYALGCVLYELLTGGPPFEGDDPMAIVSQHIAAQPVPLRERNAAVPEALEHLVLRLLEKEPEARPASAEEVLAELEAIEVAVQATAPSRAPLVLGALFARPAYRIAAAVLVIAAIGGGVAAAVVFSGGSETETATTIAYSSLFRGPGQLVSGNCTPGSDLVLHFTTEGEVTGDIVGRDINTVDATFYAASQCTEGLVRASSTFTDADGNSLSWVGEGPVSALGGNSLVELDMTVIGGTGIYEGATGRGICRATTETQGFGEPDYATTGRTDCQLELTND